MGDVQFDFWVLSKSGALGSGVFLLLLSLCGCRPSSAPVQAAPPKKDRKWFPIERFVCFEVARSR